MKSKSKYILSTLQGTYQTDAQALSVWWVFVTGGTGGFLLWKSPVRSAARILRRYDCNLGPVNNFWAFDEITHTDN